MEVWRVCERDRQPYGFWMLIIFFKSGNNRETALSTNFHRIGCCCKEFWRVAGWDSLEQGVRNSTAGFLCATVQGLLG